MINHYENKQLTPEQVKAGPVNGTTQCPGCSAHLPVDPRLPVTICDRCRLQVRQARGEA